MSRRENMSTLPRKTALVLTALMLLGGCAAVSGTRPSDAASRNAGQYRSTPQDEAAFRRADSLFGQGRYRDALALYQTLAQKGNPDAMYNTGIVYRRLGRDGEAIKWLEQAVDAGDHDAHCVLGNIQDKISNYRTARRHYEQAANAGLACGQAALSSYYIDGLDVRRDFRKSFDLASSAARQNDAHGQYLLALHYLNSWSVAYNPNQAANLLRQAAAQGHQKAREMLNNGLRSR